MGESKMGTEFLGKLNLAIAEPQLPEPMIVTFFDFAAAMALFNKL
jgi:hypothetical protein